MGAAAVPILALTTAVSTGVQISESQKAQRRAKSAANEERARQGALEDERKQKEQRERERAENVAAQAQLRARRSPTNSGRSTILTSPLGITSEPNTQRKTLLGA